MPAQNRQQRSIALTAASQPFRTVRAAIADFIAAEASSIN